MSILSHPVLRNLIWILVLLTVMLIGVLQWLKHYTHHGEKLILPYYINKSLLVSEDHAQQNSFELVVTDSVFIVGKKGGVIQSQHPLPGKTVKRGRKIYVVVTKSDPDMIAVEDLPRLYGERYDIKSRELDKGFEIQSEIVDYVYDAGLPDMIMEVRHQGTVIADKEGRKVGYAVPKGGTLEFVLSRETGGQFPIPDLVCNTYEQAKFMIDQMRFVLGERSTDGSVVNLDESIVYKQRPPYVSGATLSQGDTIHIFLTGNPPADCQ